jgi:hypothetical protein
MQFLFIQQGDGVRVIQTSPIEHYAQTIVNGSSSNTAIREGKGTKRVVVEETSGDEDEEEEEEIEETIITKTKKTTKKKKGEKKTYVRLKEKLYTLFFFPHFDRAQFNFLSTSSSLC